MATGKRYYWMRLYESFVMSDEYDYILGLPNGGNVIAVYFKLCCLSINSGGRLLRRYGKTIINLNSGVLARYLPMFSVDEIQKIIDVLIDMDLIYTEADGALVINGFKRMVGSETDYAEKQRIYRAGEEKYVYQSPPKKEIINTGHTASIKETDANFIQKEAAADSSTSNSVNNEVLTVYKTLIGDVTDEVYEMFNRYSLTDELKIQAIREAEYLNIKNHSYIERTLQRYEAGNTATVLNLGKSPP